MNAETSNARGEWVLVPREPTEAMIDAWRDAPNRWVEAYAAMLAAAPRPPAEGVQAGDGCHCGTCTCEPSMTPAVRFDLSPAQKEGAIREHLIRLGWTPPVGTAEDMVLDAIERRESSAPVGVDGGINIPAAKALIEIVGPGFKVIYRDAFRWKDASGNVLPNHYEMFSAETLARDFGYDLVLDLGYAAILRDPSAIATQPAAGVGEEIMVSTPYDVFTLPLRPSGLDGKGPRFVVHVPGPEVLAKHQPCGCVLCTCEDEKQCQGCGAKHCGNRTDHPAYVKRQPEAWITPGGDVSRSFYWCLERCLPGEQPRPLYAAPQHPAAADGSDAQAAEIEALRAESAEAAKVLRGALDARTDGEPLRVLAIRASNALYWRAELAERAEARADKLAEALRLALDSHGVVLMTDPPQDAWKVRRVEEIGRALLRDQEEGK